MDRERVRRLLEDVQQGDVSLDDALERIARLPFVDVPGARVDTHRALRAGLPEVIYAPGKTPDQIADIVRTIRAAGQDVLATRVESDVAGRVAERVGAGD